MNPTRLRDQLYTLRKQAGLTQTELAELLHIDQSNLSKRPVQNPDEGLFTFSANC
ncbi:helix-turn-helix domain-containing protein [Burkholderia cenocepacia]|nr:helix-turn-helix transcriptional regulator [Burkholderia cenocepacia]MDR8052905.1 helix-turn-helix domain-containing protein [Burkholderia cenocepacia]